CAGGGFSPSPPVGGFPSPPAHPPIVTGPLPVPGAGGNGGGAGGSGGSGGGAGGSGGGSGGGAGGSGGAGSGGSGGGSGGSGGAGSGSGGSGGAGSGSGGSGAGSGGSGAGSGSGGSSGTTGAGGAGDSGGPAGAASGNNASGGSGSGGGLSNTSIGIIAGIASVAFLGGVAALIYFINAKNSAAAAAAASGTAAGASAGAGAGGTTAAGAGGAASGFVVANGGMAGAGAAAGGAAAGGAAGSSLAGTAGAASAAGGAGAAGTTATGSTLPAIAGSGGLFTATELASVGAGMGAAGAAGAASGSGAVAGAGAAGAAGTAGATGSSGAALAGSTAAVGGKAALASTTAAGAAGGASHFGAEAAAIGIGAAVVGGVAAAAAMSSTKPSSKPSSESAVPGSSKPNDITPSGGSASASPSTVPNAEGSKHASSVGGGATTASGSHNGLLAAEITGGAALVAGGTALAAKASERNKTERYSFVETEAASYPPGPGPHQGYKAPAEAVAMGSVPPKKAPIGAIAGGAAGAGLLATSAGKEVLEEVETVSKTTTTTTKITEVGEIDEVTSASNVAGSSTAAGASVPSTSASTSGSPSGPLSPAPSTTTSAPNSAPGTPSALKNSAVPSAMSGSAAHSSLKAGEIAAIAGGAAVVGAAALAGVAAVTRKKRVITTRERVTEYVTYIKTEKAQFDVRTFETKALLVSPGFKMDTFFEKISKATEVTDTTISHALTAAGLSIPVSKHSEMLNELFGADADHKKHVSELIKMFAEVTTVAEATAVIYTVTGEPRIRRDQVITIMKTFVEEEQKVSTTSRFDLPAFVAKAKLSKPLFDITPVLPLIQQSSVHPYTKEALKFDLQKSGLQMSSRQYRELLITLCGPSEADFDAVIAKWGHTVKLVGSENFGKTIFTVLGQSTTNTADAASALSSFLRNVSQVSPPDSRFDLEAFETEGKKINSRFDKKTFVDRLVLTPSKTATTPAGVSSTLQASRVVAPPGSPAYNSIVQSLTGVPAGEGAEKVIGLLDECLRKVGVDAFLTGIGAAVKRHLDENADGLVRPPSPQDSIEERDNNGSLPRQSPAQVAASNPAISPAGKSGDDMSVVEVIEAYGSTAPERKDTKRKGFLQTIFSRSSVKKPDTSVVAEVLEASAGAAAVAGGAALAVSVAERNGDAKPPPLSPAPTSGEASSIDSVAPLSSEKKEELIERLKNAGPDGWFASLLRKLQEIAPGFDIAAFSTALSRVPEDEPITNDLLITALKASDAPVTEGDIPKLAAAVNPSHPEFFYPALDVAADVARTTGPQVFTEEIVPATRVVTSPFAPAVGQDLPETLSGTPPDTETPIARPYTTAESSSPASTLVEPTAVGSMRPPSTPPPGLPASKTSIADATAPATGASSSAWKAGEIAATIGSKAVTEANVTGAVKNKKTSHSKVVASGAASAGPVTRRKRIITTKQMVTEYVTYIEAEQAEFNVERFETKAIVASPGFDTDKFFQEISKLEAVDDASISEALTAAGFDAPANMHSELLDELFGVGSDHKKHVIELVQRLEEVESVTGVTAAFRSVLYNESTSPSGSITKDTTTQFVTSPSAPTAQQEAAETMTGTPPDARTPAVKPYTIVESSSSTVAVPTKLSHPGEPFPMSSLPPSTSSLPSGVLASESSQPVAGASASSSVVKAEEVAAAIGGAAVDGAIVAGTAKVEETAGATKVAASDSASPGPTPSAPATYKQQTTEGTEASLSSTSPSPDGRDATKKKGFLQTVFKRTSTKQEPSVVADAIASSRMAAAAGGVAAASRPDEQTDELVRILPTTGEDAAKPMENREPGSSEMKDSSIKSSSVTTSTVATPPAHTHMNATELTAIAGGVAAVGAAATAGATAVTRKKRIITTKQMVIEYMTYIETEKAEFNIKRFENKAIVASPAFNTDMFFQVISKVEAVDDTSLSEALTAAGLDAPAGTQLELLDALFGLGSNHKKHISELVKRLAEVESVTGLTAVFRSVLDDGSASPAGSTTSSPDRKDLKKGLFKSVFKRNSAKQEPNAVAEAIAASTAAVTGADAAIGVSATKKATVATSVLSHDEKERLVVQLNSGGSEGWFSKLIRKVKDFAPAFDVTAFALALATLPSGLPVTQDGLLSALASANAPIQEKDLPTLAEAANPSEPEKLYSAVTVAADVARTSGPTVFSEVIVPAAYAPPLSALASDDAVARKTDIATETQVVAPDAVDAGLALSASSPQSVVKTAQDADVVAGGTLPITTTSSSTAIRKKRVVTTRQRVIEYINYIESENASFDVRAFEIKAMTASSAFSSEAFFAEISKIAEVTDDAISEAFIRAGFDGPRTQHVEMLEELFGKGAEHKKHIRELISVFEEAESVSGATGVFYTVARKSKRTIRREEVVTTMEYFITHMKKVSTTSKFDLSAFVAKAKEWRSSFDIVILLRLIYESSAHPYTQSALYEDIVKCGLDLSSAQFEELLIVLCGASKADFNAILAKWGHIVKLVGPEEFNNTISEVEKTTAVASGKTTTTSTTFISKRKRVITTRQRVVEYILYIESENVNFDLRAFEAKAIVASPAFSIDRFFVEISKIKDVTDDAISEAFIRAGFEGPRTQYVEMLEELFGKGAEHIKHIKELISVFEEAETVSTATGAFYTVTRTKRAKTIRWEDVVTIMEYFVIYTKKVSQASRFDFTKFVTRATRWSASFDIMILLRLIYESAFHPYTKLALREDLVKCGLDLSSAQWEQLLVILCGPGKADHDAIIAKWGHTVKLVGVEDFHRSIFAVEDTNAAETDTLSIQSKEELVARIKTAASEGWFTRLIRKVIEISPTFNLPAFPAALADVPAETTMTTETLIKTLSTCGAKITLAQVPALAYTVDPSNPSALVPAVQTAAEVARIAGPKVFTEEIVPALNSNASVHEVVAANRLSTAAPEGWWTRFVRAVTEIAPTFDLAEFSTAVSASSFADADAVVLSALPSKDDGSFVTSTELGAIKKAVAPEEPEQASAALRGVVETISAVGATSFVENVAPTLARKEAAAATKASGGSGWGLGYLWSVPKKAVEEVAAMLAPIVGMEDAEEPASPAYALAEEEIAVVVDSPVEPRPETPVVVDVPEPSSSSLMAEVTIPKRKSWFTQLTETVMEGAEAVGATAIHAGGSVVSTITKATSSSKPDDEHPASKIV
ncbi:hypothetical protein HK101_010954, partial [Irineochytrium annulatum]